MLEFKDLTNNLKTYEAKACEVLLDLTFMKYELLKYFIELEKYMSAIFPQPIIPVFIK